MPQIAHHGSWLSPISAERVLEASVRLEQVRVGDDSIWWSELRPAAAGQSQIVRRSSTGELTDLLPDGFSASSSVHEYGGGAWWLAADALFFVNQSDQRIWRIDPGFEPTPITPAPERERGLRYADGIVTADHRWIICVQEVHPGEVDHDGRGELLDALCLQRRHDDPAVDLRVDEGALSIGDGDADRRTGTLGSVLDLPAAGEGCLLERGKQSRRHGVPQEQNLLAYRSRGWGRSLHRCARGADAQGQHHRQDPDQPPGRQPPRGGGA